MKELVLSTIAFFGLASLTTIHAQNVYIPDANFKAALVNNLNINTNGDTEIQVSEANAYRGSIDVGSKNISDLTGIEAFTGITTLWCWENQLTSLDLSKNTALVELICAYNQLIFLDVSKNKELIKLYCEENQLTILNLLNNMKLKNLTCNKNQINELDVSKNTKLMELNCSENQLNSLDVSINRGLRQLNCSGNQISSLDVSKNTTLNRLYCEGNQLTVLDVSNNTKLGILGCGDNQLSFLDVSKNRELTELFCNNNQLATLDVSKNDTSNFVAISLLDCSWNQLISLNIKNGYNSRFAFFNAVNNPNLICIQVDDSVWSKNNWKNYVDTKASFSEHCGYTGIKNINKNNTLMAFPNPTNGKLFLSAHTNIVLTNLTGKIISQKQNTNQIDLSMLPKGLYFLSVGERLNQTFKVIKE